MKKRKELRKMNKNNVSLSLNKIKTSLWKDLVKSHLMKKNVTLNMKMSKNKIQNLIIPICLNNISTEHVKINRNIMK